MAHGMVDASSLSEASTLWLVCGWAFARRCSVISQPLLPFISTISTSPSSLIRLVTMSRTMALLALLILTTLFASSHQESGLKACLTACPEEVSLRSHCYQHCALSHSCMTESPAKTAFQRCLMLSFCLDYESCRKSCAAAADCALI